MTKMRNTRRKISWSNLSLNSLRHIAEFLKNDTNDLCNFRLVCKNWLRSTSISTFLPLRDVVTFTDNLFSSSIYLVRSNATATPWMVCAIEITKGNIQLCHPFTLTPYIGVDITQFHQTLLTESYHIAAFGDVDCSSALLGSDKVLLSSKKPLPSITDCSLLVLLNGRLGGLHSLKWNDKGGADISHDAVDEFDDIINFKGVVYAVDWEGKLYEMANDKPAVSKTLVNQPVSEAPAYKGRRMRLVGSSSDEKLYLLSKLQEMIKVYHLSKSDDDKSLSWVNVQSFQAEDQVLFVTKNFCFFTSASQFCGCKLGNCIIFSEDAFPVYNLWGWASNTRNKAQEDIWIVQLGGHDDHKCQPISSFPGFPLNLWSPPQSILQAHTLQRCNNEAASLPCLQLDYQMQNSKCSNCDASKLKFEGVYVRSDLVPTLQKIWVKHGNIAEGSSVHSKDMLACTLESLAKVIIILQSNSGRTLTKSQCDYIDSVLMDLLHVRFKVAWLVPFVEKAIALRQSKPLIDGLAELDKKIARFEEMKAKFAEELATMEEVQNELNEEKKLLSKNIPIKEHDHLDQCVGDGLF